jgi:hypothetical protein
MKSTGDFYVFEKWKEAPEYAFGSKNKPSIVPSEDKAAYDRIFSELSHAADNTIATWPSGSRFLQRPMNFSPKFGSRGHRPVDLWVSICGFDSKAFGYMPQVYAIASDRGLEVGFAASIDEADYHDASVKARNRLTVPLVNSKLPSPGSATVQKLEGLLSEQGRWHLNTKTRLTVGDPGFDAFASADELFGFLKRQGEASGGGTICRIFTGAELGVVNLEDEFRLALGNFGHLIEACSPNSWDKQIVQDENAVSEEADSVLFDPSNAYDDRHKILAEVARRQGQKDFRKKLLEAYDGCCAISGESVPSVLQAAHITPYLGPHTNHVTNGILLRADLHTLFDLKLIKVNPATYTVIVSQNLIGTPYGELQGRELRLPKKPSLRPSPLAIAQHFQEAKSPN